MAQTKYNFLSDSFSNNFLTYTPVELDLPLNDSPINISDWATEISPLGIPIVKPTIDTFSSEREDQETESTQKTRIRVNNTEEVPITADKQQTSTSTPLKQVEIKQSENSTILNNLIDEVSNEEGFEGLKDPLNKKLLMLQAQRESNFNQKVSNSGSSAVGYFQMIDSTRQRFSNVSKKNFIDDPKEQIRAAYKLLRTILESSNAQKLLQKGYNPAQVTALGWWYPKSMSDVLQGNFSRSIGGYSTKQALNTYGGFKI